MIFSTTFGLSILWNGNDRIEVNLCDSYANRICGLCGNADSKSLLKKSNSEFKFIFKKDITNDFVNPNNNTIALYGSEFTKYFEWGNTWRVFDDSLDSNRTM